jgi:BlaR1 peptidase M56
MNFAVTLCLVLGAAFGVSSLMLSIVVALAWRGGLARSRATSGELLVLRLLPAGGAALLTLTVVLPAFLMYEPAHQREEGGPLLIALAVCALLTVGAGMWRAWRACMAARALKRECGPAHCRSVIAGQHVDIVDVPEPFVAVIGAWRTRIVASQRVVSACSNEELSRVIAHEAAHVFARDNLKLLLLVFGPDALAWLPTGATLAARWRAAAEREADERATGSDPHQRLALASALLKVARLASGAQRPLPTFSMPIAADDVAGRVRGLLAPPSPAARTNRVWGLVAAVLIVPVIGIPLYGLIHRFIEALVAFGR